MSGYLSRLEGLYHKMSIMPVRPARITDTTLKKHSVFAFLHLRQDRVNHRHANQANEEHISQAQTDTQTVPKQRRARGPPSSILQTGGG